MRIALVISELSDGGAQRQYVLLANELGRRTGTTVLVVRFRPGIYDDMIDESAVDSVLIPSRSNFDPTLVVRLRRLFLRERVEIVMSWLHSADVLSCLASRGLWGCRWVLAERNSQYPATFRFRMRRRLGVLADLVVANSYAGCTYWRKAGLVGPRCITIGNALVSGGEPVAVDARSGVVFVGRLEEQKNVRFTADVFCAVAAAFPQENFSIIGKGSLSDEVGLIVSRCTRDNVSVLGFRRDAQSLIAKAKVLVNFSHHEGQPNVVVEAVASGTRVVVSRIPEHVELLGESYPFLLSDRSSHREAVELLARALDGSSANSEAKSLLRRLEGMNVENVADQYLGIFRGLGQRVGGEDA